MISHDNPIVMEYKVVSISPNINRGDSGSKLATELESVIQKYAADGWEFVDVETLSTWVNGSSGCFGLGAQPGYSLDFQMVVFQRSGGL